MDTTFFEKVNNINWFSNCGNEFSIADFPIKIKFVDSLDKMMTNLSSVTWENFTLEARNRLTEFLQKRERGSYSGHWNKITDTNKSKLKVVEKIAREYADKNKLDKVFVDDINWNVLGASMEDHYYSINSGIPIFFKYLMEIYSQGNVPCGVIGEIVDELSPYGINIMDEVFSGKQIDFSQFTLLVY